MLDGKLKIGQRDAETGELVFYPSSAEDDESDEDSEAEIYIPRKKMQAYR